MVQPVWFRLLGLGLQGEGGNLQGRVLMWTLWRIVRGFWGSS